MEASAETKVSMEVVFHGYSVAASMEAFMEGVEGRGSFHSFHGRFGAVVRCGKYGSFHGSFHTFHASHESFHGSFHALHGGFHILVK